MPLLNRLWEDLRKFVWYSSVNSISIFVAVMVTNDVTGVGGSPYHSNTEDMKRIKEKHVCWYLVFLKIS